jgi:peptidoglycan/xylan/chitin deacetylase (PgdA/CDA1 family)
VYGYYQRNAATYFYRRPILIKLDRPVVSFTFDDFPKSALVNGGPILHRFGIAGTFYVSLGLMDKETPTGRAFAADDLSRLIEQGHELGCHTFGHCHSWNTGTREFEKSIIQNRVALGELLPGVEFRTFSYPKSPPRPLIKAKVADHFLCSRGGGQTFNVGLGDLNQLSSFFLEKSRQNIQVIRDLIDRNRRAGGWLIFSTHDIADHPTPFGCTPGFFETVVGYAAASGALMLPVARVVKKLQASWQDETRGASA